MWLLPPIIFPRKIAAPPQAQLRCLKLAIFENRYVFLHPSVEEGALQLSFDGCIGRLKLSRAQRVRPLVAILDDIQEIGRKKREQAQVRQSMKGKEKKKEVRR